MTYYSTGHFTSSDAAVKLGKLGGPNILFDLKEKQINVKMDATAHKHADFLHKRILDPVGWKLEHRMSQLIFSHSAPFPLLHTVTLLQVTGSCLWERRKKESSRDYSVVSDRQFIKICLEVCTSLYACLGFSYIPG